MPPAGGPYQRSWVCGSRAALGGGSLVRLRSPNPIHIIVPPMPSALEGLNVIECGRNFAASYCAKLMADLGATVIKVEDPSGDPTRRMGPYPGGKPHPEKSGAFLYLNCNKQGVTLDLEDERGRDLLGLLVTKADVLVHDFRPGEVLPLGL